MLEGAGEDSPAALLSWQNGPAFVAESFRGTLASILRNQGGKKQKTILITSAGPAEGKTTVIQNLGIALAETGAKVLLVDADFRRPHLHHKFGLPNEFSLIDLLSEGTALDQYPSERFGVPTGFAGLSLLPNRPTHDNVSKALYSPRLRAIFEILIQRLRHDSSGCAADSECRGYTHHGAFDRCSYPGTEMRSHAPRCRSGGIPAHPGGRTITAGYSADRL